MKPNRLVQFVVALFAALALLMPANLVSGATINVVTSIAPSDTGPSFANYETNALAYLQGGPQGNRVIDPKAYQVSSPTIQPNEITRSSFLSWNGAANPTGAFVAERGNMILFGFSIIGNTKPQDVTLQIVSTDSGGLFNQTINLSALNCGTDLVGRYTTGGALITTPILNFGSTTFAELYYVGAGGGINAGPTGTNQQKLDVAKSYNEANAPYTITGTVTIAGGGGSDSSTVTVVPEPTSLSLLALGTAGLLLRRRRNKT